MLIKNAKLAATQEKIRLRDRENTTLPFALNAVKKQEFHLNQEKTDLFSAANVSQQKKANNRLNLYS